MYDLDQFGPYAPLVQTARLKVGRDGSQPHLADQIHLLLPHWILCSACPHPIAQALEVS